MNSAVRKLVLIFKLVLSSMIILLSAMQVNAEEEFEDVEDEVVEQVESAPTEPVSEGNSLVAEENAMAAAETQPEKTASNFSKYFDTFLSKIQVGGGFGIWEYQQTGIPGFSPVSIEFKLSYDLFTYLNIQGNAGFGVTEEAEVAGASNERKFKVGSYTSVYFRPQYKFNDSMIYLLFGYANTSVESSLDGVKQKNTADGTSRGIGMSVDMDKSSNIFVEWRSQAETSVYELSGFSLGYSQRL